MTDLVEVGLVDALFVDVLYALQTLDVNVVHLRRKQAQFVSFGNNRVISD